MTPTVTVSGQGNHIIKSSFTRSVGRVESCRSHLHLIRVLTRDGAMHNRDLVKKSGRRRQQWPIWIVIELIIIIIVVVVGRRSASCFILSLGTISLFVPLRLPFLLLSEWALNSSCITILTSSAIFRPSCCCCCCNFYNSRREGEGVKGLW